MRLTRRRTSESHVQHFTWLWRSTFRPLQTQVRSTARNCKKPCCFPTSCWLSMAQPSPQGHWVAWLVQSSYCCSRPYRLPSRCPIPWYQLQWATRRHLLFLVSLSNQYDEKEYLLVLTGLFSNKRAIFSPSFNTPCTAPFTLLTSDITTTMLSCTEPVVTPTCTSWMFIESCKRAEFNFPPILSSSFYSPSPFMRGRPILGKKASSSLHTVFVFLIASSIALVWRLSWSLTSWR